MSIGRGFGDQFLGGMNQFPGGLARKPQDLSPGGRKPSLGTGFGAPLKPGVKMGLYKDDNEIDEDLNNPLFFNKSGFSQRPTDRTDISQQMSHLNLYGNPPSDPSVQDLWSRGVGNQTSKGGLPPSFSSMQIPPISSSRGPSSTSQFSRPSGSSGMPPISTGFQHLSGSPVSSGQTSPGSRGLLSMGPRSTVGQQVPPSNASSIQNQGLLNSSLPKSTRPSGTPAHSGIGSPSRSSPNLLSMGLSQQQQQQQQQQQPSLSQPQRVNSFGSLNSISSSGSFTGFGTSRSPSSQSGLLGPSLSSVTGGLLSGVPDITPISTGTSSFDLDFPALANRSITSTTASSQSSPMPNRTGGYGWSEFAMVTSKTPEGNQEFQIHNEDFPALPGTQPSESGQQLPDHKQSFLPFHTGSGTSYEQVLKDGRNLQGVNLSTNGYFPFRAPGGGDKKSRITTGQSGIQTSSSGVITNIPAGMVTDQFGMIGLLTFIRAAETEPNLVTLALGSDLTTLGLNLNSTESLYHTFGSPFSDTTCRPHEIDFHVPPEYLINTYIRDKLAPIKLGRYGEDLLFYLYYTNCGDILQLAAAAELYARDWRYHKDERVWITRAPGMEPQLKTSTYERGTYYYFDSQSWRKVAKEFHVEYDKLEERPTVQALAQQQQQQQ